MKQCKMTIIPLTENWYLLMRLYCTKFWGIDFYDNSVDFMLTKNVCILIKQI